MIRLAPVKFNDQQGISILELAIVLPFLTILVFGSIEIAMKVNSLQMVSAAAQEGAKVAASYGAAGAVDICPDPDITNPIPLMELCPEGEIEDIPNDAGLETVARVTSCNYLKQQDLDASKWLVTTSIRYESFDGRQFPVVDVEMEEQDPSCTVCVANLVSVIPANSVASMSLQKCVPI